MQRPKDLFDRETEWNDLVQFLAVRSPGIRLGVVYGRRRQGKSFLLRRLVEQAGGVYHQALEEGRTQALAAIGDRVGGARGLSSGTVQFGDWAAALSALLEPSAGARSHVAVIDELPYLLPHSPELPSLLQRLVDESRHRATRRSAAVSLLLCGSAVTIMSELLAGGRALRGRATLELVVRSFDYRTARRFWGIRDPDVAFTLHAILGGTAGHRDLLDGPPRNLTELGGWLARGILNPAHALFREAEYLLTEDPRITDRGLYHAVLDAVSRGERTPARIAGRVGRPESALRHALRLLQEAELLEQEDDVLKQRNPTLTVADPLLRFAHVVARPRLAELEDRKAAAVWSAAQPSFRAQILGPHFETLARTWVGRFASESTLGGAVGEVGPALLADPAHKTQLQLDVVALASGERRQGKRPRVRLLGEAKASDRSRTLADLARLERARSLLATTERADVDDARLALFGRAGFDAALVREAKRRSDVVLVDLERLYDGE